MALGHGTIVTHPRRDAASTELALTPNSLVPVIVFV